LVPVALAACDACQPRPSPDDGGVVGGSVFFFSPREGANLTLADDVDAAPGFQAAVEIHSTSVPDGTQVTVTVDGDAASASTAALAGGVAQLTVTLTGGPFPEGRVNALAVSAVGHTGQTIQVTVIENTATTCSFRAPTNGAVLTQDADAQAAGFQSDVVVACSGTTVQPGGPVRLQVFQGTTPVGTPVLSVPQSLSGGLAEFRAVTLPEGDVTLQASVLGTGGTHEGLVHITVRVDTNRCDARIVSPAASSMLTTQNTTDLVAGEEALDIEFTVASTLCPAAAVTILVGSSTYTGTITAGSGMVLVSLPQGTQQVVARVDDGSGPREPGESLPVSYTVDTLPPCPTLTVPAAGRVLTAADDEESPPNPANGVTFTMRGTVDHPEGTTGVSVHVLRGSQSFRQEVAPLSGTGAFTFRVDNMPAGSYRVRLSAVDQNGNPCPRPGAPALDFPFEVTLEAPAVTVTLVNDTQPRDSRLVRIEDGSDAPGMQAVVRVELRNENPANATAVARFTPVQPDGTPTGAPSVETSPGTVSGDGGVTLTVTLPDGHYRMGAVVTFSDGRPSLATPQTAQVQVDGTPPTVTMVRPAVDTRLASAVVDVEVSVPDADVDLASLALVVNGTPSMVVPVSPGPGLYDFLAVGLVGAGDDTYALQATVRDVAGNEAVSGTVVIVVDLSPPVPTLTGRDRDGAGRVLEPEVASGAQPRTLLDISTAEGLLALDYNQDRADGLQYGFAVEVSQADCASMGASPVASLQVSGLASPVSVPLVPTGARCRGVATNGGLGFTLADGDGDARVTLLDAAGNAGVARVFYAVRRAVHHVRVDAPRDGDRVAAAPFTVRASSDMDSGGTCQLLVDGIARGAPVALAVSMTFPDVSLSGADGQGFTLSVTCTVGPDTLASLPVTVVLDTSAPTGGTITLADGTALPAAFNLGVPPDDLASTRYLKGLGVTVNAEGGSCARLGVPTLTATPEGGAAVTYTATSGPGGTWLYLAGDRCRAAFANVDLGTRQDPGLVTALGVSVPDTVGNVLAVGPVSVLNDQVRPTVARTRPARLLLGLADDALPAVAGFNVVVEFSVTSDGRGDTGVMTCAAPATCPASSRPVAGNAVVFGAQPGDAVTLPLDSATTLGVTVTDQAGNTSDATAGQVTLFVDGTPPTVTISQPTEGGAFGAGQDASADPGYQVSVTVSSSDAEEGAQVTVSVNGAEGVPVCVLDAGRACSGLLTVPDGVVALVASLPDAAGNVGSSAARTISVGSAVPTLTLQGLDVGGDARNLEPEVASGTQPRTLLDISTPTGLAALDRDGDASNGLQYRFLVSVPLAACRALRQPPVATLEVAGVSPALSVSLAEGASWCTGTTPDVGVTLPDGDGDALAAVTDVAGNVGRVHVYYAVKRLPVTLRVEDPVDGQRLQPGPLVVTATTDSPLTGTCQLVVNNIDTGAPVTQAATMTFPAFTLAGVDGDAVPLKVRCTASGDVTESLAVAVVVDTVGPLNGALVMPDGSAVPAAFNTSIPSDDLVGTRYVKTLAVEVDAEAGACGRLGAATLTATPAAGAPVPHALAAGGWQVVAGGTRCRGTFALVDLGARVEAGLLTSLQVNVRDSAGNPSSVGPLSVLNDQVAPQLGLVRPAVLTRGASGDDLVDTAGYNLVVEASVTPDGRAGTASVACASSEGAAVACPSGTRAVGAAATSVVFGLTGEDAVTLGSGTVDFSATVTVSVWDGAGNRTDLPVAVNVDVTPAGVSVLAPTENAKLNGSQDADPAPGFQATVTVQTTDVPLGTTVRHVLNGGAEADLCTITVGTSCTARLTVPQGDNVLVVRVPDDVGNVGTLTRRFSVDSVPPVVSSIVVLGDLNGDGQGNAAEDGSAAAKFQTGVKVTMTSDVDSGRQVRLLSNNPSVGTVVGGPSPLVGAEVTFASVTLEEGAHRLTVTVTDANNNANDPNLVVRDFVVDTTPPTVSLVSPSAAKLLAATDADGSGGSAAGYVTDVTVTTDAFPDLPCRLLDGAAVIAGPTNTGLSNTLVFPAVTLDEGTRSLTARCTDAAGNTGTSAVYAPLVDSLAPHFLSVTPDSGTFGSLTDADGDAANGIQIDFTVVHVRLEAGQPIVFANANGALPTGPNTASEMGATVVRVSFLSSGPQVVTVAASDVNGNATSRTFTITVETGRFNVTVTAPDANPKALGLAADTSADAGLQTAITFTTDAPDGSTAYLVVGGSRYPGDVTVNGGAGSIPVTFTPGEHTYDVHVEDPVSSKDGSSGVRNLYVDLVAPTVAITTPADVLKYNRLGDGTHTGDTDQGLPGLQATVAVNVTECGTVAHPGTLVVTVGLTPVGTRQVTADGAVTLTGLTFPEGDGMTLAVTCTDEATNATTASKTITVDSVPPGEKTVTLTVADRRRATVRLTFAAPGDDVGEGQLQAGAYGLRKINGDASAGTCTVTDASYGSGLNMDSALPATPKAPGETETVEMVGLKVEQYVCFGLMVTDNEGNKRLLSTGVADLRLVNAGDVSRAADPLDVDTRFGTNLNKSAGDVDGDGYDDTVVSAHLVNVGGIADVGELTVIYGDDPFVGGTTARRSRLSPVGVAANTRCGFTQVHILPSINNDSYDEVACSCNVGIKQTFIWYGQQNGIPDGTAPNLVLEETSLSASPYLGFAYAVLDFDGDGRRDLAVSAYNNSATLPTVWVLLGQETPRTGTVGLNAEVTALRAFAVTGLAGTAFGKTLTALSLKKADPEDKRQELVVGAPGADNTANNSGSVFVIRGRTGLAGQTLAVSAMGDVDRRDGPAAIDNVLGEGLAVCDWDGNGEKDVLAGANLTPRVEIYLVNDGVVAPSPIYIQFSVPAFRQYLACLPDFNGDGRSDLLASADGAAYLYLGRTGSAAVVEPDYTFMMDTGYTTALGNADVNGDGYSDIVLGSRKLTTDWDGRVQTLY
jgi:hypothetical protein